MASFPGAVASCLARVEKSLKKLFSIELLSSLSGGLYITTTLISPYNCFTGTSIYSNESNFVTLCFFTWKSFF